MEKFVSYVRVSTEKQGLLGLGIEAQSESVAQFAKRSNGRLVAQFAEVESGKRRDRPELEKAIALCRKTGARLLIAKLDRLARNAAFLLSLRDSGIDFVCADMPHADRFTIGILALVAEKERELISERTRAGLAAAKRRGLKLGGPNIAQARKAAIKSTKRKADDFAAQAAPIVQEIKAAGVSTLKGIARCLNARGVRTPKGAQWTRQSVARVMRRL